MLDKFIEGFLWGVFIMGAMVPVFAGLALWTFVGRKFVKRKEPIIELIEELDGMEEPPPLPEPEPPPQYRFQASTIVRPPNVVSKEEIERDRREDGEDEE